MPTPPFAQVQVSVNGGGQQTGSVTVTAGQTIQLSGVNTSGWQSQMWELYDSPPGFNPGGAWSLAADGLTWQNPKVTPDSFSTSVTWGKWMIRLRVNGNPLSRNADGSPNVNYTQQLTDESTILRWASPHGLQDTGFLELGQASKKGFVGDVQNNWRQLETLLNSGGAGDVYVVGPQTVNAAANTVYTVNCSGGNVVINVPSLTLSQFVEVLQDASTAMGGHTITVNAAAGQTLQQQGGFTFATSNTQINVQGYGGLRWYNKGSAAVSGNVPLLLD